MDTGHLFNQLVQPPQLCGAAGHQDAFGQHVARKFRRRLGQYLLDPQYQFIGMGTQYVSQFGLGDCDFFRNTSDQVSSADGGPDAGLRLEDTADLLFQLFTDSRSDRQLVGVFNIPDNRFIKGIACDFQ